MTNVEEAALLHSFILSPQMHLLWNKMTSCNIADYFRFLTRQFRILVCYNFQKNANEIILYIHTYISVLVSCNREMLLSCLFFHLQKPCLLIHNKLSNESCIWSPLQTHLWISDLLMNLLNYYIVKLAQFNASLYLVPPQGLLCLFICVFSSSSWTILPQNFLYIVVFFRRHCNCPFITLSQIICLYSNIKFGWCR